ncbi:EAL domain-containing protein [archaeon]|nr:EAL domain-containing protein [archaeon]
MTTKNLQSNKLSSQLASMFFETSTEAILICDSNNIIIKVNNAFEKTTGYSEEEVIGKSPNFLKSGRHDQSFYENISFSLINNDFWCGEIWDKRKDGTIYPKSIVMNVIRDNDKNILYYTSLFTDISQSKKKNQHLNMLLKRDYLTGLDNRLSLNSLLNEDIEYNEPFAVLFMDIDNFKYINDTLGHSIGDKLLISVANRLKSLLRAQDTIARLGGDEFVVVLRNFINKNNIVLVANKILDSLQEEFKIYNNKHIKDEFYLTLSIGISLYEKDAKTVDDLLKYADLAMYNVKSKGKNGFFFFNETLLAHNEEKYNLFSYEHEVRCILKDKSIFLKNIDKTYCNSGQIVPYFQPIFKVDKTTQEIVSYEVLARWIHPTKGLISPAKFIPIVEEFELMTSLFFHIFHQSLKFLSKTKKKLYFNVSPKQLNDLIFFNTLINKIDYIKSHPEEYGFSKDFNIIEYIGFEFTEDSFMYNNSFIIDKLNQISQLGIELVIDDFGTGYSSFSYLSQMPISKIKIDGSFIREINKNVKTNQIISFLIILGKNLGMSIVSECVENQEQLDWLIEHGGILIQGFLLGKPLPAEEIIIN